MPVKFHVRDTFALTSRSFFILAGTIIEGFIRPGMAVQIVRNSTERLALEISAIEFARRQHGEDVCLCVRYADKDELDRLKALNIEDETFTIEPPTR